MFSIKNETSDTIDEGKDLQRIRCIDTNRTLHISDTLSTNTSDNLPDKDISEEMLFTVAYVKNESTSNSLDYHTSNSKGNKCMNEQYLGDIDAIKTEEVEGCGSNKPGNVTEEEHDMIKVKEDLQHNHMIEHDINHLSDTSQDGRTIERENHHVTDMSQHDRVGGNTEIKIGDICPSSATEPRTGMHKYVHKRVHSGKKRFKCDLCACRTTTPGALKRHKRIHTGEKPFKCDECDYSSTDSGHLKRHKLIHSGVKTFYL